MAHLHHLSISSLLTGMTCRNLAIVWAPNLLRSLHQDMVSEESLRDIGVQAKVVECFIENYHELFSDTNNLIIESCDISIEKGVARSQSVNNCFAFRSQQNFYSDIGLKRNKKSIQETNQCPKAHHSPSPFLLHKPPFQLKDRKSLFRQDCSSPADHHRPFQKVKT